MMFLIWRGYGLLALAVWVPVFVLCLGLGSVEPYWVSVFAVVASLLGGGAACVYYGTLWNRAGGGHSLYFVPLQAWGWAYIALVILYGVFSISSALILRLDRPDVAEEVIVEVISIASAILVAGLLVRSRRARRSEDSLTLDEWAKRGPRAPDPWD